MQWKRYFTNRYKVAILIELHCSGKKRLYRWVVLACVCVSVSVCVCVAMAKRGRRIGPTDGCHWRSVTRTGSGGQVDVFHRSFDSVTAYGTFSSLHPPSLSTPSSLSISSFTNRNRSSYDRPFVSVRVYVYRVCVSDNMIGFICMCKLAAATWLI